MPFWSQQSRVIENVEVYRFQAVRILLNEWRTRWLPWLEPGRAAAGTFSKIIEC